MFRTRFSVADALVILAVLLLATLPVLRSLLPETEPTTGNWLVIVLGNAFVCAMEGLIVGIQVLRLEYYELFSRFYKGTGHAFKPYRMNEK